MFILRAALAAMTIPACPVMAAPAATAPQHQYPQIAAELVASFLRHAIH